MTIAGWDSNPIKESEQEMAGSGNNFPLRPEARAAENIADLDLRALSEE